MRDMKCNKMSTLTVLGHEGLKGDTHHTTDGLSDKDFLCSKCYIELKMSPKYAKFPQKIPTTISHRDHSQESQH